jgi:hypothetical protein
VFTSHPNNSPTGQENLGSGNHDTGTFYSIGREPAEQGSVADGGLQSEQGNVLIDFVSELTRFYYWPGICLEHPYFGTIKKIDFLEMPIADPTNDKHICARGHTRVAKNLRWSQDHNNAPVYYALGQIPRSGIATCLI